MRRLKPWFCLLLALAAWAARTSAAGFAGRVLFADQPVPGATVIATKGDRHATTVTDEQGAFTFADLGERHLVHPRRDDDIRDADA